MSRRALIAWVVAGVVVATAAAGGYVVVAHRNEVALDKGARAAADRFADAWSRGKVQEADYADRSADQVAASYATTTAGLGAAPATVAVTSLARRGDTATGTVSVAWTVAEGATWAYTMPITVHRGAKDSWVLVPADGAAMWAPGLSAQSKLVAKRTWGKRGDILDRNGSPIVTVGKVYDVAIDPARASAQTVAALETVVQEPAGSLVAKLSAATASGSKAPIAVITYREADFLSRKAQLDALVGVIYPPRVQPLAPSASFARPLLGSYGPVTADAITKGAGRYVAGDFAGLSGLQGQYDEVLGGAPGIAVTASDKPDLPLFEKAATDGATVTLTLDPKIQSAAEAALTATGTVPSSLVAVDVVTGDLLAVANSPSLGMNRALLGQYQPGSTLKVATTYSLLMKGLVPTTPVLCPPSVVVDGLSVTNYEGETLGLVPFSLDFAHSCNTAFVQLAATMGDGDVHDAAAALGIGTGWEQHLGVAEAFGGSVPVATSKTEKAATAFGQAKTLVSPASLAVMVASVARGSYVEPALIRTPAVAGADRTPRPLDPTATTELRQLMRLVVTDGTGSALKSVSGAEVFGKTGTAEFGTNIPPQTRAWFVGWQGNVAFAVLVEEGKSGGTVAAPIARTFLKNLQT
jgi:cell division protein FtsI/penicillin-binding protein 2